MAPPSSKFPCVSGPPGFSVLADVPCPNCLFFLCFGKNQEHLEALLHFTKETLRIQNANLIAYKQFSRSVFFPVLLLLSNFGGSHSISCDNEMFSSHCLWITPETRKLKRFCLLQKETNNNKLVFPQLTCAMLCPCTQWRKKRYRGLGQGRHKNKAPNYTTQIQKRFDHLVLRQQKRSCVSNKKKNTETSKPPFAIKFKTRKIQHNLEQPITLQSNPNCAQ